MENNKDIYELLECCKHNISQKEYDYIRNDADFNRLLIAHKILKNIWSMTNAVL